MSCTVLLVDDEPDVLFAARLLLEDAGYGVIATDRGVQALEFAEQWKPDAVFLDLRMPDLDGWAVLEELHAKSETSRMPVIVLSAHTDPSAVKKSLELGARGYVEKPFRSGDLTRALDAVLA